MLLAIALIVLAVFVPRILRVMRSDTVTGVVARTASQGGGFSAVVQPRAGTKVIPSAGKAADVTLGS